MDLPDRESLDKWIEVFTRNPKKAAWYLAFVGAPAVLGVVSWQYFGGLTISLSAVILAFILCVVWACGIYILSDRKTTTALLSTAVMTGAVLVASWLWVVMARPSNETPSAPVDTEYRGRVLDAGTAGPIAGAKVSLEIDGAVTVAHSDSEGAFRISGVRARNGEASGRLAVEAQGFARANREVTINHPSEEFRLRRLAIPPSPDPDPRQPTAPEPPPPDTHRGITVSSQGFCADDPIPTTELRRKVEQRLAGGSPVKVYLRAGYAAIREGLGTGVTVSGQFQVCPIANGVECVATSLQCIGSCRFDAAQSGRDKNLTEAVGQVANLILEAVNAGDYGVRTVCGY